MQPEQAISEAAALGEKIARGIELFSKLRDQDVAIATTPKDEVWRQDKVTLHRYRPLADNSVATPVLIVYSFYKERAANGVVIQALCIDQIQSGFVQRASRAAADLNALAAARPGTRAVT